MKLYDFYIHEIFNATKIFIAFYLMSNYTDYLILGLIAPLLF